MTRDPITFLPQQLEQLAARTEHVSYRAGDPDGFSRGHHILEDDRHQDCDFSIEEHTDSDWPESITDITGWTWEARDADGAIHTGHAAHPHGLDLVDRANEWAARRPAELPADLAAIRDRQRLTFPAPAGEALQPRVDRAPRAAAHDHASERGLER